jgi:small-conductance mechanosensitive channel
VTLQADILGRAGDTLGDFLPQLGGALALLVIGLLVARLIGALVRRALTRARLDELAERWHVDETLDRAGLRTSLAGLCGAVVRIVLSVVVVFAALTLLGLEPLSQSLNEAVLFLPKLILALVLLLAGILLSGLVRERVDRLTYQMDFPVPLGQLAQIATLAIFAIMAAVQIGVSAGVLIIVIAIILAGVTATFAIAFGLGGREVARALNAGRFVRGAYDVGQTIEVGDLHGRIVAIEPDATVLGTDGGRRIRVPNHMLLESVVTIGAGPPERSGEAAGPGESGRPPG